MSVPDDLDGLRFACECVSARRGGYSDPWAAIAKDKLMVDGTKEEILNLVAREPKTIAQLAKELDLSKPSIHAHINEMIASELLRESEEWEKRYPTERYYEPNFPVVRPDERARFEALCQEMAERVADLFEKKLTQLERVFNKTRLAEDGWEFSDLTQYLYACVQREARELLEERGALQPRQKHRNGAKWVFWAEEPKADANK
jgi:DNA-binding transcriptional ArsR family regulator